MIYLLLVLQKMVILYVLTTHFGLQRIDRCPATPAAGIGCLGGRVAQETPALDQKMGVNELHYTMGMTYDRTPKPTVIKG